MTDRLKIAIVTNYPADPSRLSGGVQAVSARLVSQLARVEKLDLHIIHCHSDIAESRVKKQGNVTLHYIAQTRLRVIPNMVTGIGLIVNRLREIAPDVVHVHGPSFAVAALRAGYEPIWTIHGVLAQEEQNYPGLFNRLSFALASHYERQALERVSLITTVSPYVRRAYKTRTQAAIQVIENPAPPGYFSLPRRTVPRRVLMPAAMIPLKDPLTLIRAAARLRETIPTLSVNLAGPHVDITYVKTLKAEITERNLGGIVALLGPLNQPQLHQAYSEAMVVALPSRQEVAPMAVIEAMAAGIPVVACDVGGMPHLVQDGETGYIVPPGEPSALAETLRCLLADPASAERMGGRAREIARVRFDAAAIAQHYLALYRKASGEPGHASDPNNLRGGV